jgi:CRISPR-associated protein Csb2
MFFIVCARFLSDYQGREWPPSPARLFKAFIAVSRHGVPGADNTEIDDALRWLEGQSAPTVIAARASEAWPRLRRFVPNNSKVDPKTGEPEWPARRASKEGELIRGWRIDPPYEVVYAWPVTGRSRKLDIIQSVARRVPSLGKGEDFVVASGEYTHQLPAGHIRYEPAERNGGFTLEVPEAGCLSVCEEMFRRRAADPGWNRIHELPTMGTHLEPYAEFAEESERSKPPIAIFGIWAGGRRRSFDARILRVPVGQCRHLLSIALDEVVFDMTSDAQLRGELLSAGQALICGHGPSGGKVEGPHVAVLALPSILGPHPDGRVRRLALIGFGCAERIGSQLFEAVVSNLHDRELIDEGKGTGVVLRRETDAGWHFLLTQETTEWESVTPVVLDRPEFVRKEWKGMGHADRRRSARAGDSDAALELGRLLVERRDEIVREALGRLGLGQVSSIEVNRAPWRSGIYPASQYRMNSYLRSSPRFHIRISFRGPVPGPFVLGRGRYVGLGLFRPTP